MSFNGSMSLSSSMKSVQDLPNLPGIRRSALSSNPKLFKDYLSDTLGSESMQRSVSADFINDPEYIRSIKSSLNPYPRETPNFNDISGRYSLCSRQRDSRSNRKALPYSDISNAPAFVTNKDQICNFTAIFTEDVPENLEEPKRVRVVDIAVYVTDNSMEIREPFVHNSGLVQGKLLRRHNVQKPDGSGHYTLKDFHAGAILDIYSREYTILSCNDFTNRLLASIGVDFGQHLPTPDTTDIRLMKLRRSTPNISSNESFSSTGRPFTALSKSFYEHDKMVLRFFGYWEGKEVPKPIKYSVRIHYYLVDDTIEIISEYSRNDGRDRTPKFLRKMRILKPNNSTPIVTTSAQAESVDSSNYYHFTDLYIGAVINVVGNEILIYDADKFTRNYYEQHHFPLSERIPVQLEEAPKKYSVSPPPYNGFGSEEDSLQTCSGSLMPKAPKKDGLKAKLYAQQILRFRMKFRTPKPVDAAREFNLKVFLEDDTIQINEVPVRNSGFGAGKFLSRSRQKHKDGRRIVPGDIVLGTVLFIQSYEFIVVDADEYSLKYMEQNPEIWKESSLEHIAMKLRAREDQLRDTLVKLKDRALEDAPYDEINDLLIEAGIVLTTQESLTLMRAIDKQRKGRAKFFRIFRIISEDDMFQSW
eukprot:CAMPEP_0185034136 /NCGR_PEP_ID=MMETSP1103-20130426/23734_1 /TAXON_ID=36769 /ORGANISM="Paraphysomonas bandaiensis, Strain Caron Lab Isolate" /LENGTH=642 /DNA_ID=CAMNT_0027570669 /DNA_START=26 /DNA_END=1951 /DNA_ORIENTATION=-